MEPSRPDLSQADPEVRAYIEALEAELARLRRQSGASQSGASRSAGATRARKSEEPDEALDTTPYPPEPPEPPTTTNLITATASGVAKRTPRHLYSRQRRGGMGVFDLESPGDEPPAILALADESQHLLVITDQARAFRMPVSAIPEAPVRGRGAVITGRMGLQPDERLAAIVPDQAEGYLAMVSRSGMVRMLRHHVFGEYMKPGTALYDLRTFGLLAGVCWTRGDGDLFVATSQGRGIRFSEKAVPPPGGPGIRLAPGDTAIGITPVYDDSGVFLIGADGRGTIRQMESFNPNKAPGAGGKIAMNSSHMVGAVCVEEADDIFVISQLGKIIRFKAEEVPPKDGPVQGVICMSLRADETAALAVNPALGMI